MSWEEVVIGPCRLICADCRDILPTLAGVDVLITDPPYGVEFTGKRTKDTKRTDGYTSMHDTEAYWTTAILPIVQYALTLCKRAAIFPGHKHFQDYPRCQGIGGIHNPAGSGISAWGFNCYEPIFFYGKSPLAGKGMSPMWTTICYPGGHVTGEQRIKHPCPKPLVWMKWLIARASLPGEVVLDPFAGACTTAVACMLLGRNCIAIEIDPAYYAEGCQRVADTYRQLDFFTNSAAYTPTQLSLA